MFHSVLKCTVFTFPFLFGFCLHSSDCLRIGISDLKKPYSNDHNNTTTTTLSQNSTLPITFIHTVGDSNFNSSSDLNASVIYRKTLNVTCEGDEPIEWIYEGGGSPSKVIEKARRQGNTTISQLIFETLEKSRDFSLHTGNYICRSINNHSSNASVYIYFPGVGEKLFVGEKDEDIPEVLYLPECIDDNLIAKSINSNLELEVEPEEGKKEFQGCPKFIVPCLTTTPFVNVSLFRKTYKGVLEPLNLTYNSQVGFILELDKKYSDPQYYYSLAGEYLCIASKMESSPEPASKSSRKLKSKSKSNIRTRTSSTMSSSVSTSSSSSSPSKSRKTGNVTKVFYVYPPKTIKPTPADSIVYIGQVINFTCESNEPVMIKETEFHLPTYFEESGERLVEDDADADAPEVEETTETIPLNKHVANFIDTNPVTGSYGTFQCVLENSDSKSEKVLHEWKYFVIGKEADEKSGIKFSKRKKSFSCRSKANQPGLLSYIHCETPSECSINSVCLKNSNSCRGYKNPIGHSNRCKHTKSCKEFLHFGGNGYVRCTGELIEETKKFNETGLDQEFSQWKSELGSNSFLKSSDKTLPSRFNPTLTLKYHNYSLNEVENTNVIKLEVSLNRSRFRFVDGHTWILRMGDEFIPVEPSSSNQLSNTEFEYEFTIPWNETLRNPIEIQCQLPERNSMDWKKLAVSLPNISGISEDKPIENLIGNSTAKKNQEQAQQVPLKEIERIESESNDTNKQGEILDNEKLNDTLEEQVTQSDLYETTTNSANELSSYS